MSRKVFFGMMVASVMTLGSCGGGNSQPQAVTEEDSTSIEDIVPSDRTIYGLCGEGTAMNTLELLTDNGDTISMSMTNAQEAGKVFGGLQKGDRLAVLPSLKNKREVEEVVNMSTLLGDWIMPDPLDGSSEVGIRIKEGGVAESIEMTNITYRTWKIFNGKLEILSIREGGGEEEEMNLYEILYLGADSLAYKTIGRSHDEEETFEYSRWKEKPKVDLHGLKLEEHNDEFMKM